MPKKIGTPELDSTRIVGQTLPEDAATEIALTSAVSAYTDDRDLVNQLLGQTQMARSIARFADVVSLTKLKQIKESKLYRALAGKKGYDPDGNEIADVGTFDGFCQVLGLSRSKVDEDLANLAAFGEDALKQLSAVGVGYRELRQYRRLPEDSRTALIEAAQTGDKDTLLDLAEELIAKQQAEKAALQKAQQDAEARAEKLKRQADEQDEQIEELKEERKRLRREWSRKGMDDRVVDLRKAVHEASIEVLAAISPGDDDPAGLHGAVRALLEDEMAATQDHSEFLAGVFAELITALRMVRDNLPVSVPVREA
ncbi:hypothetical protein [Leptolyngbya phage Lsp-JY19]